MKCLTLGFILSLFTLSGCGEAAPLVINGFPVVSSSGACATTLYKVSGDNATYSAHYFPPRNNQYLPPYSFYPAPVQGLDGFWRYEGFGFYGTGACSFRT